MHADCVQRARFWRHWSSNIVRLQDERPPTNLVQGKGKLDAEWISHSDSEKRDDSQSSDSGGREDHRPDPIVIFRRYAFRAFGALNDVALDPFVHDSL